MPRDENTQKKILEAAREIFHQKGFGGARMEEIANKAGINKAMLHYYFRSKQKLFDEVFMEAFSQIFPKLIEIMVSEMTLEEKIRKISESYYRILSENPQLPLFVLSAIQADANAFTRNLFQKSPVNPQMVMGKIIEQIQTEVGARNIKPIDPRNLMINLVAMSVFPFMMKPILTSLFGMSETDFQELIKGRKDAIPQFIIDAISVKPSNE